MRPENAAEHQWHDADTNPYRDEQEDWEIVFEIH
jgi:hypothetical protein